jgi:hypothetical protein
MNLTKTETENVLHKLPTGVKLEVVDTLAAGVFVVTAEKQTKAEIIAAKFPTLIGKPITLSDASQKYSVPRTTLQKWHYRSNYITPIDPTAYPYNFDEAEIAYLSDIYMRRKLTGSRSPLIDDDGLPYEVKHPELSDYRRRKKTGPL